MGKETMKMSNSSLVNYVRKSPNYSGRNGKRIDRITIHHMAGNLSVESCGNVFAPSSRQASSNYGIDSVGRVGLYVDESNRSWCSSSWANDERAVTIEVADNTIGGNWGSSNAAMAKLVLLCADICRRNGILKLRYTGDTSGNMTLHEWFAATDCCGGYLRSQMLKIAEEVNKLLVSGATTYTWNGATASGGTTGANNTKDGKVAVDGSWQFKGSGYSAGSSLIRAIQKRIGAVSDGWFGVNSVKSLQRFLGVTADGSMGPDTVRAFQTWLNKQA